jgi:hypothetical protein
MGATDCDREAIRCIPRQVRPTTSCSGHPSRPITDLVSCMCRLYQERLDQLSHEEALLAGDNPRHPEYLAMLQCIDGRREERVRILDMEYKLRLQVLRKRATAERAQILSQFFQTIRESREKALEDLGRQWYDIQHQRRRYVNTIPEYGLRYPTIMAQNVRNAIAYNKEVSILSGIAKYRGFPAAPDIRGADANELDEDLEAITVSRAHHILSILIRTVTHGADKMVAFTA